MNKQTQRAIFVGKPLAGLPFLNYGMTGEARRLTYSLYFFKPDGSKKISIPILKDNLYFPTDTCYPI
jgi:hypothetical protein